MRQLRRNWKYIFVLFLAALFFKFIFESSIKTKSEFIYENSYVQRYLIDKKSEIMNGNNQCAPNYIQLDFAKWKTEAEKHKHPDCSKGKFLKIQDDGTIIFEKDLKITGCDYNIVVLGKNDYSFNTLEAVHIKNNEKLNTSGEFFNIKCDSSDGKIFSGI